MKIETLYNLRPDLEKSYIKQILLDADYYLNAHEDIKKAKVEPLNHFLTFGVSERRKYKTSKIKKQHSNPSKSGRKLYLSNAPSQDGSFLYRCKYKANSHDFVYGGNTGLERIILALFDVDELIFSRPESISYNNYIFDLAGYLSVKIVLDYDDLKMPEYAYSLGHVRSSVSNAEHTRRHLLKQTQFLHRADKVICSTSLLVDEMRKIGIKAEVQKNRLPIVFFKNKLSDESLSYKNDKIKILYMSGTKTHKKDYSIASGAILKLAQKFPDKFSITFLGNVGIDFSIFNILNIEHKVISKVSFDEMLGIIREHDVCLVPLENTIFNNAKSNIKFIECASQGVPVIASNVAEYNSVKKHCNEAIILSEDHEWYEKLVWSLDNLSQLKIIGQQAYDLAIDAYSEEESKINNNDINDGNKVRIAESIQKTQSKTLLKTIISYVFSR